MNIVLIISIIFTIVFLTITALIIMRKDQREHETQFLEVNKNRAIVNLYASNTKINGIEVNRLNSIKSINGQKIVALETCTHTFEGRFFAIDTKFADCKTEKIKLSIELQNGYTYALGLYFSPPEQFDNAPSAIFALTIDVVGINTNAYVICYQEN